MSFFYINPLSLGTAVFAGNVTVNGNLLVNGTTTLVLQTTTGKVTIDVTDTEALLVRKDSDAGDVLAIDTTNSNVLLTASDLTWASGKAVTAASYAIQRDLDATNQLHFNVPTNATFEFSVNDVSQMTLSATAVNFLDNSITTTGGGSLTGTWSDLGSVTTIDINGGTIDGVTIGGSVAGLITGTTITANTGFMPDANDGAYLGQSGTAFSDLFLADGGVINFNAGNYTLTHSAGLLTTNGALTISGAFGGATTGSFSTSVTTPILQTVDNAASLVANIPVTGVDAGVHVFSLQVDGNTWAQATGIGNGAGGVGTISTELGVATGITTMHTLLSFSTGQAITAASYQIGRDADATNQLHFNAPAGASMEFSFNDSQRLKLDETALTLGTSGLATIQTADNCTLFNINLPVAVPNAGPHTFALQMDGNTFLGCDATGDGAGLVGVRSLTLSGNVTHTSQASISGIPSIWSITPPANTGLMAGFDVPQFNLAASTQTWATGAVTEASYFKINAPTFAAAAASTFTDVSTFTITASPIAGTNATLTRSYGLWVQNGVSRFSVGGTGAPIRIQGTATGSYSSVDVYDSTGALVAGYGYGNSTSTYFRSIGYFYTASGIDFSMHTGLLAAGGTAQFTKKSTGELQLNPTAQSSLVPKTLVLTPAANTGITVSTDNPQFNLVASTQQWATGAIAQTSYFNIGAETIAFAGASTVSAAYGLVVAKPIAGTNATLTKTLGILSAGIESSDGIYAANGTAALPSFSFTNYTGAGMYSDGRLRFSNAGVNYMTLGVDGFTIIGTDGITVTNRNNNTPTSGLIINPYAISASNASVERTDGILINTAIRTFATGPLATQRFNVFNSGTIAFVGASLISNLAGVAITTPSTGTNATVTTMNALQVGSDATMHQVAGTLYGAIGIPDHTITLGNTTQITSSGMAALRIGQVTLSSAVGGFAIDNFSSVYIKGAGLTGGAVPPTITNNLALWVDAGTSRFDESVIFGTAITPQANDGAALGIVTTGEWSDLMLAAGGVINWSNGRTTITEGAATSALSFANTTFVGTAGSNLNIFSFTPTVTEAASGTHARITGISITAPVVTGGSATVTNASTFYISDAPTVTTSGSSYAAWIDSGNIRVDGNMIIGANASGAPGATLDIVKDQNNSASEIIDFRSRAFTLNMIGAITTQRKNQFFANTIGGAYTLTNGITVDIDASPTVNAATTFIANAYGLRVGATGTTLSNNGLGTITYQSIAVPNHTVTLNATTQITSSPFASALNLGQITIAQSGGAVTVDNAATLYIGNAPTVGASVTLTNAYSLWVNAGTSRFGGAIQSVISGATAITPYNIAYSATAYASETGLINIARSGALTGVDTESIVDFNIEPGFTLTEPGSGSVNFYGANIDISNIAVTAGAGTSVLAALRLIANADADAGTHWALFADAGNVRLDGWEVIQDNSIDAANDLTPTSNIMYIGGATQINRIAPPPGYASHSAVLTLEFASNPLVKYNQASGGGFYAIKLNGSVDYQAAAYSTLTLRWDVLNAVWVEIGRMLL